MSVSDAPEGMPRPVSTYDLESLVVLGDRYDDLLADDVTVIRGEATALKAETARQLIDKMARRLGENALKSALNGRATVGLLTIDESEKSILNEARNIQSPNRRMY